MSNSPDIFYDDDGLIVHQRINDKWDGGDTAQREGWYWFGVWIRQNVLNDPWSVPRKLSFDEVVELLEPNKDGVFYRHPKIDPYNNPHSSEWGFSRDQMIPLVAALGVWGRTDALRRLWDALPEVEWEFSRDQLTLLVNALDGFGLRSLSDYLRNALSQGGIIKTKHTFNGDWNIIQLPFMPSSIRFHTGDLVGPATINLFRRAWGEDPMAAGDSDGKLGEDELAANSALKIPPALTDRDDTGNDLNHIIEHLMAKLRFPSDVSEKSANAYCKNRLISYGSFVKAYYDVYGEDLLAVGDLTPVVRQRLDEGIKNGWVTDAGRVYGAVRWYHRVGKGANPKLAEIYEHIIRKYLE